MEEFIKYKEFARRNNLKEGRAETLDLYKAYYQVMAKQGGAICKI